MSIENPRFQEFTPSVSPLISVDILLDPGFNDSFCPGDVTVKVRSGSTTGPILGQATITNIASPTVPTLFHFDFTPDITVVTGNVHYFEAQSTTPCPGMSTIDGVDHTWMFQTFGPQAVGGLAVDLDGDLGDLPLETAQSSGGNTGVLAGTIAGITALAVTLTGAAWYARRRWIS
ncbi:MAG: hypothetical protein IIC26_02250 [Chloroflexi bacterium]|nr:hypothetical protein [Chloroflexota bacterium]